MAAKIVYYGPGLCGKTSNLSYIYAKTSPTSRGEMVSLETESDRTLFFDLLPIEVGTIGGFKTRLQLYTVPGQVFYNTTRKLVLKGVDGLVFVADSQRPMREANLESFASLRENLAELGLTVDELPVVLQYNKRDLKNILTVEEMNEALNPEGTFPHYESSAIEGDGVFETLKEITKITLKKLRRRMASPQEPASPKPKLTTSLSPSSSSPAQKPMTISASALARAAEEGVDDDPAPSAPPPETTPAEKPSFSRPLDHTDPGPAFASKSTSPPPPSVSPFGVPQEAAQAPAEPVPDTTSPEPLTQQPVVVDGDPFLEAEPDAVEIDDPGIVSVEQPEEIEEVKETDDHHAEAQDANDDDTYPEAIEFEPSGEEIDLIPERTFGDPDGFDDVNGDNLVADASEADLEVIELTPENGLGDASDAFAEPDEQESTIEEPVIEEPVAEKKDITEHEVKVEFDQTGADIQPPPMKRVQVSNQLDILAELDGLRKQATMKPEARKQGRSSGKNLDLDSLLGSEPRTPRSGEVRKRIAEALPSDVLDRMQTLQFAIRVQNGSGETIHTLNPLSIDIKNADGKVSVQLSLDLTPDS